MLGIFTPVFFSPAIVAVAHPLVVEDGERPEVEADLLAAEEEVVGHVEVVGERQGLEHRLDAGLARRERARRSRTSWPSNQILPAVRCSTAVIWRTKVDLPAPLSPMIATCSPLRISKLQSISACTPP